MNQVQSNVDALLNKFIAAGVVMSDLITAHAGSTETMWEFALVKENIDKVIEIADEYGESVEVVVAGGAWGGGYMATVKMLPAPVSEEHTSLGAALKDAYAKRNCVNLPTHQVATDRVIKAEKELGFYQDGDEEALIAILRAGNASVDAVIRVEGDELVISFVTTPEYIDELNKVVKTTDGRFELVVTDFTHSALVTIKKVKPPSADFGKVVTGIDGSSRFQRNKPNTDRAQHSQKPNGYTDAAATEALKSTHEGYEKALRDKDAEHQELMSRFSKNISEHREQMAAQTAKQATALKYGAAVVVGVGIGIAATMLYNNYVKK